MIIDHTKMAFATSNIWEDLNNEGRYYLNLIGNLTPDQKVRGRLLTTVEKFVIVNVRRSDCFFFRQPATITPNCLTFRNIQRNY